MPRAPRANGKILVPQGREQVGNGLQWADHFFPKNEARDPPKADDQQAQRPLRPRGVLPAPEQNEREDDSGHSSSQAKKPEFRFVGHRLPRAGSGSFEILDEP